MRSLNRRDFFNALSGGAACAAFIRSGFGQAPSASAPIAATRLDENLVQITGAGNNIVVLTEPQGLLMVNGGRPERSEDLGRFLSEQFPGQPVRFLFNTDWHLENTGSNEMFGRAGATMIAHANTKLWLRNEFLVPLQNRRYKPRAKEGLPTQTFYRAGKMEFGREQIHYGYLGQAHTDGDIYVYFPRPNILVASDVVTVGSYPIPDYVTGGWINGIAAATQTLLSVSNPETRIIPAAGPPQPRAHLQAEADMLAAMRDRFIKLLKQGLGIDDMIAAGPTKDYDAEWGNPELFIRNIYPGLWGHARELGGIV